METALLWALTFIVVTAVCTFGFYYYVGYRNMKQQKKHFETLHRELSVGQKVEFANGLRGKVKHVGDEECDIEVKSGAIMTVSRYAISQIIK